MLSQTQYLREVKDEVKHLRNLLGYVHSGLLVQYAPHTDRETRLYVECVKTCALVSKEMEKLLNEIRDLEDSISTPYIL